MSKYRVSIVVEARDLPAAIGRFIYDDVGEPVENLISIEGEAWD